MEKERLLTLNRGKMVLKNERPTLNEKPILRINLILKMNVRCSFIISSLQFF